MRKIKVCESCGELKPHSAHGLCHKCYNHKMNYSKPMEKNKTCPSFLGIHVTEKLLLKRFKNTKAMSNNNEGFDFVCNKNYKIDAKASVLRFEKNLPDFNGCFEFNINKNQIADYFCCVAYDDRENLNVINAWLIPKNAISKKGKMICELMKLSIAKNQMDFWKKYEMDINILDNCCNSMK